MPGKSCHTQSFGTEVEEEHFTRKQQDKLIANYEERLHPIQCRVSHSSPSSIQEAVRNLVLAAVIRTSHHGPMMGVHFSMSLSCRSR